MHDIRYNGLELEWKKTFLYYYYDVYKVNIEDKYRLHVLV